MAKFTHAEYLAQIPRLNITALDTTFLLAHKMAFAWPLTNDICIQRADIMHECCMEYLRRGVEQPPYTG